MVRLLTKHTRNGDRYIRPPRIEADIAAALALNRPDLVRRALLSDPRAAGFIQLESLVHLIRKAHRELDEQARDQLLSILLVRCEAILATKGPESKAPNAGYLRDEALGRLGELFAEDGTGDIPDELDFFEVRFKNAFAALRKDLVRAEIGNTRRGVPLSDDLGDDAGSTTEVEAVSRLPYALLRSPATQECSIQFKQLLQAINNLPPDEREAVILCHIMGYDVEADDPTKETAATRCGVTGRTIRYRLTRAAAKLSQFKESI
jgi:hypothetical protein